MNPPIQTTLANVTPERTALLDELKRSLKPAGADRRRAGARLLRDAQRQDPPAAPRQPDFANNRNGDQGNSEQAR